jgi:hypothetical protein
MPWKVTSVMDERMKGGGLFSRDKSKLICAYYPLCVYAIRAVETGDVQ